MGIWHSEAEKPVVAGPVTGLIAIPDEEGSGEHFLLGIVMWRDGQWLDEDTSEPITRYPRFWWCLEEELLADLPKG